MATAPDLHERFEQNLFIAATPATVFACFFQPDALRAWWQAVRSVTTPVPFGVYAIEWQTTPFRDDLLGPLGGVFHGTVVDVRPGQQFLVAEAYWVPPEGEPLGPMALHITCSPEGDGCKLKVRQDGYEPSPRWRRYYAVVSRGWQISLTALKRYAEAPPKQT
ncbi:MAG TPA: SRPBCC domain-containing protein [Vicinamibacterales bacterium]|nr:SRPBCC domain-containing protein [Vicinamibacterales bacterium]